jgi:hypothetical protein
MAMLDWRGRKGPISQVCRCVRPFRSRSTGRRRWRSPVDGDQGDGGVMCGSVASGPRWFCLGGVKLAPFGWT